ncbi:glycosyltransferase family 32 protein [Jaapia argillacea MUCL 33604]|uniref:Glycosyltransferase family 32 protein n=1 Tax=Jaapia argillacea MUCL 33604 TaxID=933084 RepID=A0A067QEK0_9AGAM|nr:glycosyltransferase family 32 protein [Jaapia argillacea MUCL 33604]
MFRRRTLWVCLSILGLILLNTLILLSSISYYLSIDSAAYLTESELSTPRNATYNATEHERVPRILHQTWKSETLPARWKTISQACREMMPDYEYMLWTDASSREFIAEHYPWFLDTFDNYIYPIQRADAIRYFVLYHYGGVYMDLDMGCLRRMDPLLAYPIILPKTIPVGISNDLMFAEKGHPFMAQTIHNLITFDHNWILNYPTVMFSTGPMFLSAQYGLYTSSHPATSDQPGGEIRVLPKSLYGKNAKPGEAPHAFFSHFYGSSWHAGDAGFIGFLGKWGTVVMWVGLVILIGGLVKLAFFGDKKRKYGLRRISGYEVVLPRWQQREGRWHLDLGWFTGTATHPSSPISLPSPTSEDEEVLLPLPFGARPSSPSLSEASNVTESYPNGAHSNSVLGSVMRAGSRIVSAITGSPDDAARMRARSQRSRRRRGVLYFLPTLFPSSQDIELAPHHRIAETVDPPRYSSSAPPPLEKRRYADDLESASLQVALNHSQHSLASRAPTRSPSPESSSMVSPAPPYDGAHHGSSS